MMQPNQWKILFANPDLSGRTARNTVASQAREHLATLAPGITISTNDLVEAMFPRDQADKTLAGDNARTKLYQVIQKLATDGLEDCCIKGEVNGEYMGRPRRPWLWFCPPETETCCMCGQPLPATD